MTNPKPAVRGLTIDTAEGQPIAPDPLTNTLIRPLEAQEVPRVSELMAFTGATVAGIRSPLLFPALCRAALREQSVVVLVGYEGHSLAGFVCAVIHPRLAWPLFLIRNPRIALQILRRRLKSSPRRWQQEEGTRAQNHAPEYAPGKTNLVLPRGSSHRSWKESTKRIAKIVHVGIAADFRNRGVASRLYRRLFEELSKRGIRRVDAQIAKSNQASIRLHHITDWSIEHLTATSLFATKDLTEAETGL